MRPVGQYARRVKNIYFALTEAFNRDGPIVALASGQAVVFYRIAIMSKDGDWVIRESPEACARVLDELERRGARYRLGAPLDVRWLAGGWSSHFEFFDEDRRRVRCDFVSRPPRVAPTSIAAWFDGAAPGQVLAVDPEALILMKQTQRAKDYAVIAELAARLSWRRWQASSRCGRLCVRHARAPAAVQWSSPSPKKPTSSSGAMRRDSRGTSRPQERSSPRAERLHSRAFG
jgi:hypothetical protein